MKKNLLFFLWAVFSLFAFIPAAWSADCLAIRKQIEQETDLLQRKELAKQGVSDCPNDPVVNFEYAYSMERIRKYKLALKHYQIAAKLAPKYGKSYFGMGDMYMNLDRPADAVKAYQAGLSLEPNNKRAQLSMEEAKKAAKDQGGDDEIAAFENPLAVKPQAEKPAPKPAKAPPTAEAPTPFEPKKALIMQEPEVMKPIVATPLKTEPLQSMDFDKAGHTDVTGSLDDNQMGAD